MRDELLKSELFLNLTELKYDVERWRMDYNHYRPHSSMDYQTPAAYAEQSRNRGCTHPNKQAEEMKNMVETLS